MPAEVRGHQARPASVLAAAAVAEAPARAPARERTQANTLAAPAGSASHSERAAGKVNRPPSQPASQSASSQPASSTYDADHLARARGFLRAPPGGLRAYCGTLPPAFPARTRRVTRAAALAGGAVAAPRSTALPRAHLLAAARPRTNHTRVAANREQAPALVAAGTPPASRSTVVAPYRARRNRRSPTSARTPEAPRGARVETVRGPGGG
jgi:hypothetical protein